MNIWENKTIGVGIDYYLNYSQEHIFEKLLEAREERVNLIDELSSKYKNTVVCLRANYPGLYKINEESIEIVTLVQKKVKGVFNGEIAYSYYHLTYEGPIGILVIDAPTNEVKKETVKIEETHPLGRLVDIDVYDKNGIGISREDVGFGKRKCFLCEREAHICVRSKAHEIEEIKNHIKAVVKEFMDERGYS